MQTRTGSTRAVGAPGAEAPRGKTGLAWSFDRRGKGNGPAAPGVAGPFVLRSVGLRYDQQGFGSFQFRAGAFDGSGMLGLFCRSVRPYTQRAGIIDAEVKFGPPGVSFG